MGCGSSAPTTTPQMNGPKPPDKPSIKPYNEVITKEAKSDSGLFITHRIKEKLLYEIPKKELGKEFLFVSTQAKAQAGIGYGGDAINEMVVKWERIGDKILLRNNMYVSVASDSLPVSYAVKKANNAPIIGAFDILAYNKDSSAVVVDVTELFTTDVAELGMNRFQREQLKVRRLDSKRSFIESAKSFPTNIEVEAAVTYDAGQVPNDFSLATITMTMHHSMIRLPEKPMMPRLYDARVQFFGVAQYDYGYDAQRAEQRRYIARWRLEPNDTAAFLRGELVEPAKPIVYYIDRGVPEKWRKYLKQGVEDWQAAFEKAGFKNAIIAKDAPSVKENPNWSSEDARYATIRWLPSEIQNAYGPHISDPRTGEILDSDIGFFHNVMNLARNWFFVQTAAANPQAQKLPLSDEVMGEMLRYICAHEIGHTLGFPHNMKATSQYPVDSLRSKTFTEQFGTESSIMDYGRFNYVAQPGDNVRFIPLIGPYDTFATEWGYRPIIGAKNSDEEKTELAKIVARQEKEPYLRFGNADGIDPSAQTEDLGSDAVASTSYGLKNIARIADMLLNATTQSGEDYSTLKEVYGELIGQRNRELGHVANVVGGISRTERYAGTDGVVFTPFAKEKQKEAMELLTKEAFKTPTELLKPDILSRIEPSGANDRVVAGQKNILNILLNNDRLTRMVNTTALNSNPYSIAEMFADLRAGVWSELQSGKSPDVYRRNLQRAYIEVVNLKFNPLPFTPPAGLPPGIIIPPPSLLPGEARALLRNELIELDKQLASAHASDKETKAHYEDSRYQISKILNPDKK